MSMQGLDRLMEFLLGIPSQQNLSTLAHDGAYNLLEQARANVPRETGELEGEIREIEGNFEEGVIVRKVGVPDSSPAIVKARATEYGTWNYDVGTPEAPKVSWPSKTKDEAMMPWLSTAARQVKPKWRERVASGIATALVPGTMISAETPPTPPPVPPVVPGDDKKKKKDPPDDPTHSGLLP